MCLMRHLCLTVTPATGCLTFYGQRFNSEAAQLLPDHHVYAMHWSCISRADIVSIEYIITFSSKGRTMFSMTRQLNWRTLHD